MVPHFHEESCAAKRTKLQLLYHRALNTLSSNQIWTQDQVDMLSLALSSVPLSELCLERSEQCQLPEPNCPTAIGHHMDKATHTVAAEEQHVHGQHAPPVSWVPPPITYLPIWEDSVMSLGVFCLPALSQIPLHDHPGMTVFTRVLYGQMHYMAYDWVIPSNRADHESPRPAHMVIDRTMRVHQAPVVLFPRAGGNLHQLTALSDCAILSLLCPPYNTKEGRDCQYYRVIDTRDGKSTGDYVLLEECDPPCHFYIGCGRYRGEVPRPRSHSPNTSLDFQSYSSSLSYELESPSHRLASTSYNFPSAADRGQNGAVCHRLEPRPNTIPSPQWWQ